MTALDLKSRVSSLRKRLRLHRKERIIVVSCVALAASYPVFDWLKTRAAAPTPEPSLPGGYYEEEFPLVLNAPPYGKIYYTTDGSTPSENSQVYHGGIPITDRSAEPNVYHSIRNVVKDWKNHTPAAQPVKKGTVIRAVYISDWGSKSDILTQTYFVGIQPPEQGYTLSLVFEDEDVFGQDGIYVTGKAYDDWYLNDGTGDGPLPNYMVKREVGAVAELLGETGDVMNQNVGIRIQGKSARERWDKRFTLVARKEFGGSPVFDTVLYDGVLTHSVMLKSQLPDAIIGDLASDRAVALQGSIPVSLYLNGEHWYDCYMLERYDEQYFRQHYQVDDRVLVKNSMVKERDDFDAQQYDYTTFMGWVKDTDFTDPTQWTAFQEQADVQSYIDYTAINCILCNLDYGDYYNYVLWRAPSMGGRQTDKAKWQWCVYDVDALTWVDEEKYGPREAVNPFGFDEGKGIRYTSIFASLKENAEFRQRFATSFMDILNNNFAPERVETVLNHYGYDLDYLNGFFRKRPEYAAKYLAQELNLTGELETVTVTADPEMGSVTVNTSQIDLSSGSWSGRYYTDYPITVTAQAKEGCEFVGWKGDADTTDPSLTLSMDGGRNLEAVFVKTP